MLGQFGPLVGGGDMSQMLDGLGDTRVVLYISERSHLPLHTLVDMTIQAPTCTSTSPSPASTSR